MKVKLLENVLLFQWSSNQIWLVIPVGQCYHCRGARVNHFRTSSNFFPMSDKFQRSRCIVNFSVTKLKCNGRLDRFSWHFSVRSFTKKKLHKLRMKTEQLRRTWQNWISTGKVRVKEENHRNRRAVWNLIRNNWNDKNSIRAALCCELIIDREKEFEK